MDLGRDEAGRFMPAGDALQPLSLRLRADTRAQLQLQADAAGLPLSLYCRHLLEAAAADQPCG